MMMNGNSDKGGMDSTSGQEAIQSDDIDVPTTHPALVLVFRMENILEEICRKLEWNDLKQFRLVSRSCNEEAKRAFIDRDRHWVVVESKNDDWKVGLDNVLTKLEKTASEEGGEKSKKSLGWIFKRFELNYWDLSLGSLYFLKQWGHYLRKIHLKIIGQYESSPTFNISHFINTLHQLLTVCCPSLDEMVVSGKYLERNDLSSVFKLESLEFLSPLPKLKCLRITDLHSIVCSAEGKEVLLTFFTRLVQAAVTALETLEIGYNSIWEEGSMLKSLASSNLDIGNFQSLKQITLEYADNVGNLSHTVRKCFPELTNLILESFYSDFIITHMVMAIIRPESFPAVKSLTIHDSSYEHIADRKIVYFLQYFPTLEVLTISSNVWDWETDVVWPEIPDPIAPLCKSLQSFTFKTDDFDIRLLRATINMFPNLVTLNLLAFGRGNGTSQPEYSFDELIDIVSPLRSLQHLYVNHAFHTSPQLVNAIQLASNLTALETLILSQGALDYDDDYDEQEFNVSLYLSTTDPEFLYILNCDGVKRLKLVQLLSFRFGTTLEEVEEAAAAKGGHVLFGRICPCYTEPGFCDNESSHIPWWKPINHAWTS